VTLPALVKVYESDNTTLVATLNDNANPALFRQVRDIKGKVELEGVGTGELVVDYDHPQVSTLTEGRIVRVEESGRTPLAFTIDRKRSVRVPRPGQGDEARTVSVSGDGLRGVLKYGRVLPWTGTGLPTSRRRRFDWSSPLLDTSDWTAIYDQDRLTSEPGKPFGLPSLFRTKWIAGEVEATNMTIGDTVYRREFTMLSDQTVSFFCSWDDGGTACLEGIELLRVYQPFPAKVWHQPWRAPVELEANATYSRGTYVFAMKGTNDGGKAGVICDAWTTTEAGIIDQVFMSGLSEDFPGDTPGEYDALYGTWLAYPNPTGEWFTPGEILRILLDECQDRGELLAVTLDFDDVDDSDGVAWPKIEFECDATGTFLDAVNKLEAEGWIDVSMSHTGGLVLSAWNKDGKGSASAVSLQAASSEIAQDETDTDMTVVNDVLLVHDKGLYLVESALSVLAYGRRPGGTLQVGSIDDATVLDQIGAAFLAGKTTPAESRTVVAAPTVNFAADIGDTITVEATSGLRVVELAFDLLGDGTLSKTPVLTTPVEQTLRQGARTVDRLIAQYGESDAAAAATFTGDTGIETGAVDVIELENWSWSAPEDLDPEWFDVAEENPRAWQPYTVKESCRLIGFSVLCDWAEPDGAGDITQVTTGETKFRLKVNGEPLWNGIPFVATVPEVNPEDLTDPTVYAIQYVLGEGTLSPNDVVSVAPELNGDHVHGTVQLLAVNV